MMHSADCSPGLQMAVALVRSMLTRSRHFASAVESASARSLTAKNSKAEKVKVKKEIEGKDKKLSVRNAAVLKDGAVVADCQQPQQSGDKVDGSSTVSDAVLKMQQAHLPVAVKSESIDSAASAVKTEKIIRNGWQPPDNWRQLLDNIRLMRMGGQAPVDLVGCEKCVDPDASPKTRRYEVLVSLMLSSQTRDEVTHAACERLRSAGLSPQMILDMNPDELGELIKPVGFWRKKVVYLKKVAEILIRDYDSDIPDTVEKLCNLPGVGPKMSHLAMSVAWDQVTGIAVDTHVHRICNRLKFVNGETKDPIKTEHQIEDWLPRDLWPDFNYQLVGFGQTICTPRNPKCNQCLNQSICPSSEVKNRSCHS